MPVATACLTTMALRLSDHKPLVDRLLHRYRGCRRTTKVRIA